MTIEDVKKKKSNLEKTIESAIASFEKETGVQVSGIGCTEYKTMCGYYHLVKIEVEVTIKT